MSYHDLVVSYNAQQQEAQQQERASVREQLDKVRAMITDALGEWSADLELADCLDYVTVSKEPPALVRVVFALVPKYWTNEEARGRVEPPWVEWQSNDLDSLVLGYGEMKKVRVRRDFSKDWTLPQTVAIFAAAEEDYQTAVSKVEQLAERQRHLDELHQAFQEWTAAYDAAVRLQELPKLPQALRDELEAMERETRVEFVDKYLVGRE